MLPQGTPDAPGTARGGQDPELERLIEASRGGDAGALDALASVVAPIVEMLVHRHLGRSAQRWTEVEDVTSLVVREVLDWLRREEDPVSPGRLRAWTEAVAARRCIDVARSQRRLLGESALPPGAIEAVRWRGEPPDDQALAEESSAQVSAALDRLDELEREVFRLVAQEGRSYDRVGEDLGLSRDQVYRTVARVRARLRRELGE